MRAAIWRRVFIAVRFWVETKQIISPSRGILQIKGVVPSSSCCAGGVPARWRGDSRDGKQPPRELFHPRRRAVSCEAALRILSNGEACPPCGGDSGMTMGGRDSFAVGLGAVAGACVGRWTGQPRMPPQERRHPALRRGRRGGFWFGGFFHTLGSGWHERVRGGGFNPLRGATTGVVMRRRATSGEMARGGLVFVFSLGIAPVSVCVLTTGVVIRRRAVSGETARGG